MTLKEQALEHWKDNKQRLKAMNWKEWCELPMSVRREMLFCDSHTVPCISGDHCSYCRHYSEICIDSHHRSCPLYEAEAERDTCCKEWRFVREALLRPTTKSVASRAINRMIKRLEALEDEQEISIRTEG